MIMIAEKTLTIITCHFTIQYTRTLFVISFYYDFFISSFFRAACTSSDSCPCTYLGPTYLLTYLLTYKADYEYEVDQVCQIQTDGRTDNYDSMSRAL